MLLNRAKLLASPAANTVFTTVLTRGPVVRPEIARITGLSSAAVTKAVKPMIEAGYLEELPQGPRTVEGAGRPAHPSPSAPTGSSSWASRSRPTNSSVWSPT
ncbi:winged helix-turn-helix transcriptional regulator [Streptomyces aureus]|uniref:winged helix-turn-helix transcriptional regulator n=1 Tax=Streptomyces aureus TaxID=193461 RepID=UPI00363AF6A2